VREQKTEMEMEKLQTRGTRINQVLIRFDVNFYDCRCTVLCERIESVKKGVEVQIRVLEPRDLAESDWSLPEKRSQWKEMVVK
jgi:hypothetical protein